MNRILFPEYDAHPRAVFQVEIARMPGAESVSVGQQADDTENTQKFKFHRKPPNSGICLSNVPSFFISSDSSC